jgi:hypothetical protein
MLTDRATCTKYYLDTSRIYIFAVDSTGKILWKTDPWKDNKLEEYRVNRPTIIYFALDSNKFTGFKKVIWITYNSSQFGFLDLLTGKFTFQGQD